MINEVRINAQHEQNAQQTGNGVIYRRNWSGILYVNHVAFTCFWRLIVRRTDANTFYHTVALQDEDGTVYIDNQERAVGDLIERALLEGILGRDIVNRLYNQNEEDIMPYESPLLAAVERVIHLNAMFDEITVQLNAGHDINTTNVTRGDTALHLAARANHHNLVEWLLDNGANHRIRNNRQEDNNPYRYHEKPKEEAIRRNNPDSWETVVTIENKVRQIKQREVVLRFQEIAEAIHQEVTARTTLLNQYNSLEQRTRYLECPTPSSMIRDLYRSYLKRDPEPADIPEGIAWGDVLRVHGYNVVEKGVRESKEARDRVAEYGVNRYMNTSKPF